MPAPRRVARRTARRTSRRMAGSQQAAPQEAAPQEAAPQQAPPPPAPAATPMDDQTAELKQLGELHAQGILTDEEFAAKKKQILGL